MAFIGMLTKSGCSLLIARLYPKLRWRGTASTMRQQAFNSEDWKVWWSSLGQPVLPSLTPQLDMYGELASRPRAVLIAGPEGYSFVRRLPVTQADSLAEASCSASLVDSIASLTGIHEVWLSLPAFHWFGHSVEIQAAARREMDSIVALEAARTTPFLPGEAVSGWYAPAVRETGPAVAHNVIVRRDIVAPIAEALADAGVRLAGVLVRDGSNSHLPVVLQWDEGAGWDKSFARARMAYVACAVLAVAAGAFLYLSVASWSDRQLAAIEAQKDALKPDIAFVTSELEAAKRQQEGSRILLARRNSGPLPVAVIAELTRLLPDHTALSALTVQPGSVDLEGISERPEDLIAVLEQSPLFADAVFSAPVTSSPTGSFFAIRARLEPAASGS